MRAQLAQAQAEWERNVAAKQAEVASLHEELHRVREGEGATVEGLRAALSTAQEQAAEVRTFGNRNLCP